MPFLFVLAFVLYLNLYAAFRLVIAGTPGRPAILLHLAACGAGAAGFLMGAELIPAPSKGIAANATNYCVYPFFACGLISLLIFSVYLVRQARATTKLASSLRFGMALWGVLCGVYLCATVIDHWWFFRDPAQSGTMDASISNGAVTCQVPLLAHRTMTTMEYRCPQTVRLGRDYSEPFVPWPSYKSGDSVALKVALDKAMAEGVSDQAIIQVPASEIRIIPQ
jgi:hypothetical protein